MFAQCKGPIWRLDDFSPCFQHDYLQTLIPLLAVGISVLIILAQVLSTPWRKQSQKLQGVVDATGKYVHVNGHMNQPDHPEDSDTDNDTEDGDDLTLQPAISHAQRSTFTVDKPSGALLLPVIEEIIVLADLGLHIAALATGAWGKHGNTAAVASIVAWIYIVALTTARLFLSARPRLSPPHVWYHTAALFFVQWLCAALLFRSQLTHPQSNLARALMIAHFSLVTLLTIIASGSRMGNAAVEIEHEGDLEPSREITASVFSLLTFSWLDPLVIKGYKQTLDISDVWNLIPEDKAATVLANYRQLKKTSSLAAHLLKHFKGPLLLQAAYAAAAGVLTFVPTLLLKLILEYVEAPGINSASSAWFYVILLFFGSVFSAIVNGQAFFIGRKVCIQLRAIIIGEIYAKALRRRAAATTADKVLGQQPQSTTKKNSSNDEGQKPKSTSKLSKLGFGKKKDKTSKKDDKEADEAVEDQGQVSSGAIINLMAVDSFKVAEVCAYLHFLWAETPLQLIIAVVLLYELLGYSSIAGIFMMVVLAPVNLIISKQFASVQKKILAATDARIHVTNEVLTNIRIIKYFAWEQRFMAKVDEKRVVEIKHLRTRYLIWCFAVTVWSGAPVMITFLTFLVYTLVEHRPLIPSAAFTALSLFSTLRMPLDQLADMVAHVQEAKVSVDRIEEYLNEPETAKYEQLHPDQYDDDGEHLIGFEGCTVSWGSEQSEDFKLIDMDMKFKIGQLNVIAGTTGSGKTSMLMALLGEMTLLSGSIYLPGSKAREDVRADPKTGLTETVAYCAQQAWLLNGTIQQNIVFAGKFDSKRYREVIKACALQRDLEILDQGDQTLVGEKGVTLSGGQKQRISLARALYSSARHVLLDDVLSAVDAHTAKWIFDKALMGSLMQNRTCILVTHNVGLCIPRADFAVILDNGRVTAYGTADEVIESGKLSEDLSKSRTVSAVPSRVPSKTDLKRSATEEEEVPNLHNVANAVSADHGNGADLMKVPSNSQGISLGTEVHTPVSEETKAVGRVSLKTILMYLASMGGIAYWVTALVAFALQQFASVGTNVWIAKWANAYGAQEEYSRAVMQPNAVDYNATAVSSPQDSLGLSYLCVSTGACFWDLIRPTSPSVEILNVHPQPQEVNDGYYLGVYAVIGFVFLALSFARNGWVFYGSIRASERLHRRLIETVLRAKLRFFDSTPLGQIMNRFSKDIEAIDQQLASTAEGVVYCLACIATIILLISIIIPQFLVAAIFISLLYFVIAAVYISSSRDLKRLESIQRSPLYQQFGETLSGMTTIRAYNDERRFVRDNLQKVNTHNRPFIFLWAANRWLALRVDAAGALVSFITGVFIILSVGRLDAGAAGLALTYAFSFNENVVWFVRLYSMNEQNMNAVERVQEYFDVEKEADAIIPDSRPPANWPSQGGVEFLGYSTKYRDDLEYVLKEITFKVLPGEKVGVVGRTGAGKSSLALALFRALEASEGKILVDDVDIGLIGLQDLRENIVMVPQDPTLFTGTIRNNLDPFSLYTDEEIFAALRRVHLISGPGASAESTRPSTPLITVNGQSSSTSDGLSPPSDAPSSDSTIAVLENKNVFLNLSSHVAESGSNLSQGQRQLLCLARALLKSPGVLLMDEATASIDYATDAKIQETLRDFKNTTLTIAHRLQTIIDYDKVLVLDKGEVIEYGSPYDLIRKDEGSFRSMCETSGEYDQLIHDAKKASDARKLVNDE